MRRVLLAALLTAAACADDASPLPSATIIESLPAQLDPDDDTADDLTIRVSYSDGDGDLGGGTAEVVDCRASGLLTVLAIPPIASEAAVMEGVPIEGELDLLVADVGRVAPDPATPAACADVGVTAAPTADSVTFCVTLIDAAGNRGPGDCTTGTVLTN
jgi:hypothetical protein